MKRWRWQRQRVCRSRRCGGFPKRLPEIEYPVGFLRRKVDLHGNTNWRVGKFFLGEVLSGETVGVEEVEDGWRVWFGPLPSARLDARQVNDPKAKRNSDGKGRWKATFLDGSGALRAPTAA